MAPYSRLVYLFRILARHEAGGAASHPVCSLSVRLLMRTATAIRLVGCGNFLGLLLDVASADAGYFNDKRIR